MKRTKFILSLLTAMLFAVALGGVYGAPAAFGAFAASNFISMPKGTLPMAVNVEIWTDYIIENLFKDNEFLLSSVDESQYVLSGSVVHIPQAGVASGVKRNRMSVPASITRRKDIDITYVLDELTTDPRYIANADKAELSYDKLNSCMSEDMAYLKQYAAESMLYNWRPQFYIKSSGQAAATNTLFGTGNRTSLTVADFAKAKSVFNKWSIPKEDRFVQLSTEMYDQICDELRKASNENIARVYDPITGKLTKLEGFTIYERATVLLASNASLTAVEGTKYFKWTTADLVYEPEDYIAIEQGAKPAATTSCACGLFWSKTAVARALGTTDMFEDTANPQYYGDIYSFLQRIGGRARRADGKGVLGIIQAPTA